MYTDGIGWFQYKAMASSCLIVLLAQFILIVDSVKLETPSTNRQMCLKLQSMLSFGKYQTSQISSNITYASRTYAQNFLAYSSMDDLLILIEPKHLIHVYNAQTVQLIVNISTSDVVIATSGTSLLSDSPHDLYFIYQNNSETNLISLRVCLVRFNIYKLSFDQNYCIETLKIQYDQPDLRVHGFTIKRDHAETKKSLLFISTEIGLIYVIFDTRTGSFINVPLLLNETLNEGSVVLSSSGSIYYASKQEHLIYELRITRDFRLRYGNITKTNAIKSPFGLITDECNHLYIATRSMIMIIYAQNSAIIRSVFAKPSDLPIILERLNATTYVYTTIKRKSAKIQPNWMFNFLYFTVPEKSLPATRHPVVNLEENLDFNITIVHKDNIPILWPLSYSLLSMTNISKQYTQFSSTPRKPFARFKNKKSKQAPTTVSVDQEMLSNDKYKLSTQESTTQKSTTDIPDEFQETEVDYDLENLDDSQFDYEEQRNQSLEQEIQSETHLTENTVYDPSLFPLNLPVTVKPLHHLQNDSNGSDNLTLTHESRFTTSSIAHSSDSYFDSKYLNTTMNPQQTILSNRNLSFDANEQLDDYLGNKPSSDSNYPNRTMDIKEKLFSDDDLRSYLQGRANLSKSQETQIQAYLAKQSSSNSNIFSEYLTSTKKPRRILLPDKNIHPNHQREGNYSITENIQTEDYSEELLPSDLEYFNSTTDSEKILFTVDDLRSYLRGQGNLSLVQQAQIHAYLTRQSASNESIFYKYQQSTKRPSRIDTSDDNMYRDDETEDTNLDEFLKKIPLIDSKYFNFSTDSEEILIPMDDLRSYLLGQGNLSKSQEAQIQAYLSKQSSSDQNIFSKYLSSTKKPSKPLRYDSSTPHEFQTEASVSRTEDTEIEDYFDDLLPFRIEDFNRTIDSEKILFTVDDLRSYLGGRGNLTSSQKQQIETFLARQSSSTQNLLSKYSKTIKSSTIMYTSDDNLHRDDESENTKLEEFLKKIPLLDSNYINISTDSKEILIPVDDLRSYLLGQRNLSKSQEAQIQTYLARQSSSNESFLSKYSRSTKQPTRIYTSENNLDRDDESEDIELEEFMKKVPLIDSKYFNISAGSEEILIPIDDLRSYIQGGGNLSKSQEAHIQAYLSKQSLSDQNIFAKYLTSTKKPSKLLIYDSSTQHQIQTQGNLSHTEDTQTDDYSEDLLRFDLKYFNVTTDSDKILFTVDDLRSYLAGRENLTNSQKTQIQAYLARQSISNGSLLSKYSKTTKSPTRMYTSDDNLAREGEIEDTRLEEFLKKIPLIDSKYFNISLDSEEMLIPMNDLRLYLQGRANLSKSEEAQIQAYLSKQSSSDQNIFSKYLTSTKKPDKHPLYDKNTQYPFQTEGNLSLTEDMQPEDYSEEVLPTIFQHLNHTIDSETNLFSVDDLLSYLNGRGNLTLTQNAQIQAYLAKQSSSDLNIFSKYSTSTRKPRRILFTSNTTQSQLQRDGNLSLTEDMSTEVNSEELLPLDLSFFNQTADFKEILFSIDDLRSYLGGRGNLTSSQKQQIETFLARQSSSNQSLFSKYAKTTKLPTRIYTTDDSLQRGYPNQDTNLEEFLEKIRLIDSKYFNISTDVEEILIPVDDLRSYLQGQGNLSLTQEGQFLAYLARQSWTNHSVFEHFNRTTDSEKLFSLDDLRSFLQGSTNLSLVQQAQIHAYLARQLSSNQTILSTYSHSTKPPGRIHTSDNNSDHDGESEDPKLEELLKKIPLIGSKYSNFSTDSEEILISIDDIRSYLRGRGNLSKSQEAQIQAYLAKQSSSDQNIYSKYLTSTKMPRRPSMPDKNAQSQFETDGNQSHTEDTEAEDYLEELLRSDFKYFNYTKDTEEILFTVGDLRSYLEGRGNLTNSQKEQIQAYLARQSSSNQTSFFKYTKSTKPTTGIYTYNDNLHHDDETEDTKLDEFLEKIQLIDSKYFNFSTDSEQVLIPIDDVRSYLRGQGNLSKSQEAQIQAYLAEQSSSGQNIFSKYLTSTKMPRRPSMPDKNAQSQLERQGNHSVTEDAHPNDYAKELLPYDLKYFNGSTDSEEISFTVDDLRSYLRGQGNLSKSQEAQIHAYLTRQSASNESIFYKYSKSTKQPTQIYTSDDTLLDEYQSEEIMLEEFLKKIPLTDSNHFNLSTDSEEIIIPMNDLRSYLRGGRNLSLIQEAQIQSYLAKQISLGNNTFPRYLTSTRKPTETLITGRTLLSMVNGSGNINASVDQFMLSLNDSSIDHSQITPSNNNTTVQSDKYEQPKLVDVNVSPTPHPSSPFVMFNTTLFPSRRSRLSSPLPRSPKSTRLSSSKLFSEITSKITTMPSYSTGFPSFTSILESSHQFSSMQTTDTASTSDIPQQKAITTHYDLSSSSPLMTQYPRFTSTISSALSPTRIEQSLTTKSNQYRSELPETHIESSSATYTKYVGIVDPTYQSIFTSRIPSAEFDPSPTKLSDKTSPRSVISTSDNENLGLSNHHPLQTTEKLHSSPVNDRNQFDWTSTNFPHFYKTKTLSTLKPSIFDLPDPSLTTTARPYRSRKQKITRWRTQQPSTTTTSSSTTTIIPVYQTTSIPDHKSSTSTQISIWHSQWNPLDQQQTIIIKPPLTPNDSNTLLSNDLLNKIFNNISTSTNSSKEQLIYFNLIDLPPSSWNLSLKSNESIILDVALPSSNTAAKTNLTFTNIEANRFSTNIIGQPIHLQIDHVHSKQFSLKMNTTDDDRNSNRQVQYLSDVIIGHVKSEQFQLNLTKLYKMNVHIQQIDSATAELYLDSSFCTNESSLDINLNLSENGTIRYGNRPPIYIGPVFTRVHMLNQSCDRDPPLALFFDICERKNPCSNGGTCVSLIPDYNDVSYSDKEIGQTGYRCNCPLHTLGEHCQHLEYPLGYCLNDGTLFQIYDRYNKSIEKCICPIGFHGKYCEENIDNCIGIRCSNHGICEDGIEMYKCSCFDGFYGLNCERTRVKTVILQAASRSFGIIAILLIAAIAVLVVASDIHTYITRKNQKKSLLNKIPRVTSEVLENSVLLLGFSDAPIEMNDLSIIGTRRKPGRFKQRQMKRTTRIRKPIGYRHISRRRPLTKVPKSSAGRYLIPNQPN